RNIGQLDEACRQAGLRLVENSEMLGIDELRDLACEIGADAGELSEILAAGDELGGAARKVLDRSRGPAVRANAERIGTFDLEQIGEVIESGRNLGVVNRHWASSFLVGLPLSPAANCPTCLDQDQAADGASWQRRDHPCLRDRSGTFLGRRPAAPQHHSGLTRTRAPKPRHSRSSLSRTQERSAAEGVLRRMLRTCSGTISRPVSAASAVRIVGRYISTRSSRYSS